MIKKIVAILALMLFVLSVIPLALADEGHGNDENNNNYEQSESRGNGDYTNSNEEMRSNMPHEELENKKRDAIDGAKDHVEKRREELKDGLKEIKKEFKDEIHERKEEFKADMKEKKGEFVDEMKDLAKDGMSEEDRARMKEAQTKFREMRKKHNEIFSQIKDDHKERRKSYMDHKNELARMKNEAKDCSEEECAEKKTDLKNGVKKHLQKTADLIKSSLEKLTNRVEASEKLSDEAKKEALAKINALEEELAAKQQEIETLAGESSSEEVRNSIQSLKKTWQEVRKLQRRIVSSLTNSKQENLLEKHEKYRESMERKIAELKEKGVDTSELEELIAKFSYKTDELREDHSESKEKWQEAIDDDSRESYKESQQNFKNNLGESKEILREFISNYKDLNE